MHNVNVPLLRKTLEWATNHPEEHRQDVYGVRTPWGTAYCIAGKVAVDAGHKLDWDWGGAEQVAASLANLADIARRLLGLPYDSLNWASKLFGPRNSLADLWRMAADYTEGEIEVPEEFR